MILLDSLHLGLLRSGQFPCSNCIISVQFAWRWILGEFYNYYCGTDWTYHVYCSLCRIVLQGWRMMIFVLTIRTRRNHSDCPVFISPHCDVRTISLSASHWPHSWQIISRLRDNSLQQYFYTQTIPIVTRIIEWRYNSIGLILYIISHSMSI